MALFVEPFDPRGRGARSVLAGADGRQGRGPLEHLERIGVPRVGVGGFDGRGAVLVGVGDLLGDGVDGDMSIVSPPDELLLLDCYSLLRTHCCLGSLTVAECSVYSYLRTLMGVPSRPCLILSYSL